jgi:uncharacterized protein (DUF1778 family)
MPTKKTHTKVTIKVPTHKHRAIKEQATLQGISMTDYIIACVQDVFDKEGVSAEEIVLVSKAAKVKVAAKPKKSVKSPKQK